MTPTPTIWLGGSRCLLNSDSHSGRDHAIGQCRLVVPLSRCRYWKVKFRSVQTHYSGSWPGVVVNSSAPRSKQTSFVIDIFSKSEGCVEKYLKKLCWVDHMNNTSSNILPHWPQISRKQPKRKTSAQFWGRWVNATTLVSRFYEFWLYISRRISYNASRCKVFIC